MDTDTSAPAMENFSVNYNGYQATATEPQAINSGSTTLVVLVGYPGPYVSLLVVSLVAGAAPSSASILVSPITAFLSLLK